MHADPRARAAGWEAVKGALARLREDSETFERFCAEQIEELDEIRVALLEREQRLARQQATWNEELATARAQVAKLAALAMELADTRAELVRTRGDLEQQHELLTSARTAASAIEDRFGELTRQNAALEAELSRVRQSVEAEKRQAVEERTEWITDLLQRALDMHGESRERSSAQTGSRRADPVLSAVMAQFETLQKGRRSP
jgi:chromosome segregation ATPase